jgi:DNA-binding beta-propeller fold protein YncE
VRTISPGYGSTPIGVAITPDGTSAFVTLMGKGELKRYSVSSGAETGTIALGPTPRAIAITGDGTRVLVTRFLADLNHGMVWDVANGTSLSLNRTYRLVRDRSGDGASNGRGIRIISRASQYLPMVPTPG